MFCTALLLTTLVANAWTLPAGDESQAKYNLLKEEVTKSAKLMMDNMNLDSDDFQHLFSKAEFDFETDLTEENKQRLVESALKFTLWDQQNRRTSESWQSLAEEVSDKDLQRQFKLLSRPQTLELPQDDLTKFYNILADMTEEYSLSTACKDTSCGLKLTALEEEFRTNRNVEQLGKMYNGWRRSLSQGLKFPFTEYLQLANKGAKNMGYTNQGQRWRAEYEDPTIKGDANKMFTEFKPLYDEFVTYVRFKLREFYGTNEIPENSPIPAHVLGDINSRNWENIFDIVTPYKDEANLDVSDNMEKQKYTTERVYRIAEDFYKSMGFQPLPSSFWRDSVFYEPTDKNIVCHSEVYDFSNNQDFAIKDCSEASMRQLTDAFINLGSIHYAQQYKNQPLAFKKPASPAFKDMFGKIVSLSAMTPTHLHEMNLLEKADFNDQQSINFLMRHALRVFPEIASSYATENWRWELFEEKMTTNEMNCKFIDNQFKFMGIKPPSIRSSEDFDASVLYEVIADKDIISEFFSNFAMFQANKAMCKSVNRYEAGKFHQCNLYNSREAGTEMSETMSLGASQPTEDIIFKMTEEKEITSKALLEYFQPLYDYLVKFNQQNQQTVGWEQDGTYCTQQEALSPLARSDVHCAYVRTSSGVQCI